MAMSKCRECGKAVSTLAKTCPSCGVPKPAKVLKKKTTIRKTKPLKTKKDKPSILSTRKSTNWQDNYNPITGSFDKGSGKIKNDSNYASSLFFLIYFITTLGNFTFS
jgi:ribosomal protein L37E